MNAPGTPSSDAGFSAPVVLLLMAMLILGIAGISVDLWRVISEHREVAGLVDGAAAAGATAIDEPAVYADPDDVRLDPSLALGRTCDYLRTRAGITSCPGGEATVVVSDQAVAVTLERDVDLTLLRLLTLGADDRPITVRGAAIVTVLRGSP